jgi:hypothetical protein
MSAIVLTTLLQVTIIPATRRAASFSPKIGASNFAGTKTAGTKTAATKTAGTKTAATPIIAKKIAVMKLLASKSFPHRQIPQPLQPIRPQRVSAKNIRLETPLLTVTSTVIRPPKFRGAN